MHPRMHAPLHMLSTDLRHAGTRASTPARRHAVHAHAPKTRGSRTHTNSGCHWSSSPFLFPCLGPVYSPRYLYLRPSVARPSSLLSGRLPSASPTVLFRRYANQLRLTRTVNMQFLFLPLISNQIYQVRSYNNPTGRTKGKLMGPSPLALTSIRERGKHRERGGEGERGREREREIGRAHV